MCTAVNRFSSPMSEQTSIPHKTKDLTTYEIRVASLLPPNINTTRCQKFLFKGTEFYKITHLIKVDYNFVMLFSETNRPSDRAANPSRQQVSKLPRRR